LIAKADIPREIPANSTAMIQFRALHMVINKDYRFNQDIYVDYGFKEVMFRCDYRGKIYRNVFGKSESTEPAPSNDRLFNNALQFDDEIYRQDYNKSK
jgi:hypothetical protein